MPVYLTAERLFMREEARRAMRAYGVKDALIINAVWELDNTCPENINLDFLPGSKIKDCIGAVYELAMMSGQMVSASANGLKFTAEPLPWERDGPRKLVKF